MYKENILYPFAFIGKPYTICDNWFNYIPKMSDKPIKYLEIGLNDGVNIISVCYTYASNPHSKVIAIDPFLPNPDEYDVYETMKIFQTNIEKHRKCNMITHYMETVEEAIKKIDDNSMDIIYIADNKDAKTTVEKIFLSFSKLKDNGYLIVDNYYDIPEINTAIDVICCKNCYKFLGDKNNQFFIQKKIK